jgi:two-component system, sensor histidine kinase and response regulator
VRCYLARSVFSVPTDWSTPDPSRPLPQDGRSAPLCHRELTVADSKSVIASAITRAQDDLAQALAELEKASTFAPGSIAFATHALNNYLTVTGAAVELISRRLESHPDAQIRIWLEGLGHATDMMSNIVNQLMTAAVSTDVKLRFEPVDFALMLERFHDFYQRAASSKSIDLVLWPAADIPPVWTDRVAIASVFDNLLSNAIKYSKPGKQVWIALRAEEEWVLCEVRDEGPGLNQADQTRLFQKGVRLTPQPTGGERSMGYGLAVAKELMEKLGGEIWCESVLGRGTSFFVRLPVHKETNPGPEAT